MGPLVTIQNNLYQVGPDRAVENSQIGEKQLLTHSFKLSS